jgi:riboflavin kinase/FMN adenylyltransferase
VRIFRHTNDVHDSLKGAVVAIGNFDGVHRGHQTLIGQARRLADERHAPLGVLAFEPHPQEFFRPGAECFRLTPLRTKARLLAEQGVDAMYALPFDAALASKSAQDFVMDVLVDALAVGQVVVGPDFRFGKARAGDTTVLSYMGEMEGFGVTIVAPVEDDAHGKISSTRIRDALKAGRPQEAAHLLGHWWTIEARVEHGDKRGRTIGVPTANMHLDDYMKPAFGVYAVRATVMDGDKILGRHDGVANLGVRPMFETQSPLLETWLFDFDGDLYGKHLAVELVSYMRQEAKFDDLDELKEQIATDAYHAKSILHVTPQSIGELSSVEVEITRWVDDEPQPGIVECKLTDAAGSEHLFVMKYYDATDAELGASSSYPQRGSIPCKILSMSVDASGQKSAEIDTDQVWRGHETIDGLTRFQVSTSQLRLGSPEPGTWVNLARMTVITGTLDDKARR